ncbi:AraD1 family protein [Marinomonas flavescens]|uniref:AraD1 family protein n=1 Tax=Marinomonas flavescens TaxID=2529379 RepID=UPI0010559F4F|nr:AraD1 family protein [Marinomonas flavescens]
MKIVQFKQNQETKVALVKDANTLQVLDFSGGTYALALLAIRENISIKDLVLKLVSTQELDYRETLEKGCLLPPITHPDPAHCLVSGTGLTHLGSASARSEMHAKLSNNDDQMTDSMKMFKLGVDGGKPNSDEIGSQPEWFYKGDGSIVCAPGAELPVPNFAEDAGEEPELVGVYIIDKDSKPRRVGFAIGNEFSDHITERSNYLWLAHSKLRACSYGPEIILGDIPEHIEGESRIYRNGEVIWEQKFLTGEANMTHSISNLEHHHFKYKQLSHPGDIHIHFFGTATLSFSDGVRIKDGDKIEIEVPAFGMPLSNTVKFEHANEKEVVKVGSI